MDMLRLLLVDDQELIRESLHIILEMEEDFAVVGLAENGRAALDLCAEQRPDVVLMDLHMPEMDGVEATRRIKAQWPEMRVIVLTTFQEVQYVSEALSLGAEGYLLKAIHPKDLVAGIRLVHRGGTLIPQELAKQLFSPAFHAARSGATAAMPPTYGLSDREQQILRLLAEGLANREIARQLYLSEGTVKNYISSIYSKLDVRDRFQAAKKAQDTGMV
jgi:DNA-binding NarL/FixJ family response regulator